MSQNTYQASLDQKKLIQQMAEVQGASYNIMEHVKEIELLMYRISICAPDMVSANSKLNKVMSDWATFKVAHWQDIQELSLTQNWTGA